MKKLYSKLPTTLFLFITCIVNAQNISVAPIDETKITSSSVQLSYEVDESAIIGSKISVDLSLNGTDFNTVRAQTLTSSADYKSVIDITQLENETTYFVRLKLHGVDNAMLAASQMVSFTTFKDALYILPDQVYDVYENVQVGDTIAKVLYNIPSEDWVSVKTSYFHTGGIKTNQKLYLWGANHMGQIPNSTREVIFTPTEFTNFEVFDFSLKDENTVVIKNDDRSLWGWGRNHSKLLGENNVVEQRWEKKQGIFKEPQLLDNNRRWKTVDHVEDWGYAIAEDGSLWGWGYSDENIPANGSNNTSSTLLKIGDDTDWKDVIANDSGALLLKENGELYVVGRNIYSLMGHPNAFKTSVPVKMGVDNDWDYIAPSYYYSAMAIKTDGSLWAWGANHTGQLGLPKTNDSFVTQPTKVHETLKFKSASVGHKSGLAVSTDGELYGWGNNLSGELGNKEFATYQPFTKITTITQPLKGAILIGRSGAVLTTNGTLKMFGSNDAGQLGAGEGSNFKTPRKINLDPITKEDIKYIKNDFGRTGVLLKNGEIWMFGRNDGGALGRGHTDRRIEDFTLQKIKGEQNWKEFFISEEVGLGVKEDGTMWSWGANKPASLGIGINALMQEPNLAEPNLITGIHWDEIKEIRHITARTLVIKKNGELWGWGRNVSSWLGLSPAPENDEIMEPTQIGTDTDWDTFLFDDQTYLVASIQKNDGSIWMAGDITTYQIPTMNPDTHPDSCCSNEWVKVFEAEDNWKKITSGSKTMLGLKHDGTIWAWGSNEFGSTGQNTFEGYTKTPTQIGSKTNWVDVQAVGGNGFAINTNNEMWSWGENAVGQMGDNSYDKKAYPVKVYGNTAWKKKMNGWNAQYAIDQNDDYYGWGYNQLGSLGALGDVSQEYLEWITDKGVLDQGLTDTTEGYLIVTDPAAFDAEELNAGDNINPEKRKQSRIGFQTNSGTETNPGRVPLKMSIIAGSTTSPEETVYLNIINVNDNTPISENIETTTTEEKPVTIPAVINDMDNDPLTVEIITNAANGTVTLNESTFNYTPEADFYGEDSFSYKSSDGTFSSSTATVTVTVLRDTDKDGIANNEDTDDDDDGYTDSVEQTEGSDPLNSDSIPLDTDQDKTPNSTDTDDDNDGVLDTNDDFPLDPTETTDTDNDGIGNNQDSDDDDDGYTDSVEQTEGSDPLNSDSIPLDTDQDKTPNSTDTDDDNDGVLDTNDDFPLDPTETTDTDNDGIGNNQDTDDDGDQVLDIYDECPNTPLSSTVNAKGCAVFILPTANYNLTTKAATCIGEANGVLDISINDINYTYHIFLNNTDQKTIITGENSAVWENLAPGNYTVKVTVEGQDSYEQLFEIGIGEPSPLEVNGVFRQAHKLYDINLNGGTTYEITLNKKVFTTTASSISLALKPGNNKITVKTNLDCQGVFTEEIYVYPESVIHPNPVQSNLNISLGKQMNNVQIKIFNNLGTLLFSQEYKPTNNILTVPVGTLSSGFYLLHIIEDNHIQKEKFIKE